MKAAGLPIPEREYRFCKRRFRFDFAWPGQRLAVEVHGGIWMRRGSSANHASARGVMNDTLKRNYAVMAGWRVLEFVGKDVENGAALGWIMAFLKHAPADSLGADRKGASA